VSSIKQNLEKKFKDHRIVLWYDGKKELRSEFDELNLSGVEKLIIDNNELGLKYYILRENPDQKFLLYHEGEEPKKEDNWLLDIKLAYTDFRTDQIALYLLELGHEFGPEYNHIIENHIEFFKNKKRRESLIKILKNKESKESLTMKILATTTGSPDVQIISVIETLFEELAEGKNEKYKLVEAYSLNEFFWMQVDSQFKYKNETPTIKDFAIELFKSAYHQSLMIKNRLSKDVIIFIQRWKDSIRNRNSFEMLSEQFSTILSIDSDLENRSVDELENMDFFELIDRKIISELVNDTSQQAKNSQKVEQVIKARRNTYWFEKYETLYNAILAASLCIERIENADLSVNSLDDGIRKYSETYWEIDYHYRKLVYNAKKSAQASLMNKLLNSVENLYSNKFLLSIQLCIQYCIFKSRFIHYFFGF